MKTKTKWPVWLSKNDKLRDFLKKNKISNESAYEDFRVLGEPAYIDKIDLKRLDYYYDSLQDNPIRVLELSPFWVHFIEVNNLPANEITRNILNFHGINLVGDLMQYNRTRLLKFKYFNENILIQLSNSIYRVATQNKRVATQNKKAISFDRSNFEKSWYKLYLKENPSKVYLFNENDISDENTYQDNKHKIPSKLISEIDEFRFLFLKTKLIDENPISLLNICPHWLLEMNIKYFRTNQRIKNLFKEQNIGCLRDLLEFTLVELSRMKNMGSNSIKVLYEDILHAKQKGPPPTYKNPLVNNVPLFQAFAKTIDNVVDLKHKFILEARLGFHREQQTLEAISEKFEITRESVRQIQNKAINYIIDEEFWDDSLKFKLLRLMRDKSEPVVLETLTKVDPWFYGFQNKIELLKNIIQVFSHLDVKFIECKNRTILSDINQEIFDEIIHRIIDGLEETIDLGYSDDDIEAIIENELSKYNAEDLSDLVFECISQQLNFLSQDGQLVLTSIGNGKRSRLKVILGEAQTPLHYSQIKELYEERFSIKTTKRNIHAALNINKFWLYGRGIYGVKRHLPLDTTILKNIAYDISQHIEENADKQWHITELLKLMKASEKYDQINLVDKYIMNICLQQFSDLTYLGKMVWASSNPEDKLQERIQIKDAIVKLLTNNNAPMNIQALTNQIQKMRGLPPHYDLSLILGSINGIGKTGPLTWGLIYRDFGENEIYWNELTRALYKNLHQQNSAIHKSELMDLLLNEGIYPLPKITLALGIINADSRFRNWGGGFIGLTGWNSPNRLNIRETLEILLSEGLNNFTIDELKEKLSSKILYKYNYHTLRNTLIDLGYNYDVQNKFWSKVSH